MRRTYQSSEKEHHGWLAVVGGQLVSQLGSQEVGDWS